MFKSIIPDRTRTSEKGQRLLKALGKEIEKSNVVLEIIGNGNEVSLTSDV